MLTVREALALPVFASARVVAGQAGLDNLIRSVYIVDVPDSTYEWGRQGVFLLTAGFSLQDAPKRQAALIPKLVEQNFAGLVFSIDYYFQRTPQIIRQAADELGFPVIETPGDVLFIDILEAIFEQIVNRQYALLQQSSQIHKQLTNLVLRGGNLNDLATTLATLLDRSVLIEDTAFRVLATAEHGPVDEARRRSVMQGYTTGEVAQRLFDAGIYERLQKQMVPIHVPSMPDLAMPMERIVAPIIVHREIYGYIWIIAGDQPLTDLHELAIDHGATVAALIMLKEQAVREAREAMRGDFLEQLLRGAIVSTELTEQARQLGYQLNQPHQVLLLCCRPGSGASSDSLIGLIDHWFRKQNRQVLMDWRDEGLVLVIESNDPALGKQLATTMVNELSQPIHRLLIGVGTVGNSRHDDPAGVRHSYEEAREAVRVGLAIGQQEGVVAFNDLGLLHWLYHLPPERRAGNTYLKQIVNLAEHDARHKTDLVKTLETYLDHGGSLVDTAAALYIHRNTLLHRLERIKQLCPLNLRDPLQRLNLHAAIKSYRLHGE